MKRYFPEDTKKLIGILKNKIHIRDYKLLDKIIYTIYETGINEGADSIIPTEFSDKHQDLKWEEITKKAIDILKNY